MDVIECIKTRKSTKQFSDKPLSDADIQIIVDAARHAPSGMNKQSWHFVVVSNKPWLEKMNKKLADYLHRGENYMCYYGAPVLVIVSANPEFPTSEADCACAIENMYLAANSLGIGACWINQLGKSNCEHIRAELTEAGVPEKDMVYGCCALGYPPEGYHRETVKRVDGTIKYFK